MKHFLFFCALALWLVPTGAGAQKPVPAQKVDALLYSTMASTAAHCPEMAMDGDPQTFFQSAGGMSDTDQFMVRLSRPVMAASVRVETGNAEGDGAVTSGVVETSADGARFRPAAAFGANGVAQASLGGARVAAIRILLRAGQGLPSLRVREIVLGPGVTLGHVQRGPGRGFVNIARAPDVAAWAHKAEMQMERSWDDTAALLYTDKFIPPNMVAVEYRTGPNVTGIAATGGGVMTINAAWCRSHPDDTGLTVHETAHVIQAYSSYNPVWLVEGIADYIRWVRFEPEHFHPRINIQKATYHDSYQTTATFLGWCALHYDSALVTKLSGAVRFGAYSPALFQKNCCKDVAALWAEFVAAYQADPVDIITPPVAAAARPRPLPAVAPGTSAPADLLPAFNTVAVTRDSAAFSAAGGADGEGAAYSAALLGTNLTWHGVQFRLGPPDAPNAVSCAGEVMALPVGRFRSLWLLGTGLEGAQKNQTLIVTYADGSTDTLAQNFSDWFEPQEFAGESHALKMAYRNTASGAQDRRAFYVYAYGFAVNSGKIVRSLTLPAEGNVKVLAVSLAN